MSLADLPSELLIEIVGYLRPDENLKPATGVDAAWRRLVTPARVADDEEVSQMEHNRPLSPYASLYALSVTCSLFKEICSPLVYEDLDIIQPIQHIDDFCATMVIPHAAHIRHIRIAREVVTDAESAKILELCHKPKSIALYGENFADDPSSDDRDKLDAAILKQVEEACLDTIGFYGGYLISRPGSSYPPLSLLHRLSQSTKGSKALKRLDIATSGAPSEVSRLIRTSFPSLEALTCFGFLDSRHPDIWSPAAEFNWGQYTNLTRLQFRDGSPVYSSQISYLVRHFPSLTHLLVSTCDNGMLKAANIRPDGWYKEEDALWRVRKPLKIFHMEHMDDDEITVMGDIPTKTLIVANLRGDHLIRPLEADRHLFPGLRCIHIEPPAIPEYPEGTHPFDENTLASLEKVCAQRDILLMRDAEATRMTFLHGR